MTYNMDLATTIIDPEKVEKKSKFGRFPTPLGRSNEQFPGTERGKVKPNTFLKSFLNVLLMKNIIFGISQLIFDRQGGAIRPPLDP